jgi:hypothetical protein
MPRPATKLNLVGLTLWGPGGHEEGKDPLEPSHAPKAEALDDRWNPPAVQRVR